MQAGKVCSRVVLWARCGGSRAAHQSDRHLRRRGGTTSMNRFLAIVTAGLSCVASAAGQVINYPNFSSTAGLSLAGSATISSNTIQLTPATTNQAGAVWYTSPVDVQGSFTTTFSYTISGGSPADGFAFVIQNSPSGASFAGNSSFGEPVGT